MGAGDTIQNKAEEFGGKVKETVGDLTNNPDLEAEGKADQAAADAQQAVDEAKDAYRDAAPDLDPDSDPRTTAGADDGPGRV